VWLGTNGDGSINLSEPDELLHFRMPELAFAGSTGFSSNSLRVALVSSVFVTGGVVYLSGCGKLAMIVRATQQKPRPKRRG